MEGHGGSSAGSYFADPTSPIPSHCASVATTSTLRVKIANSIKSTTCNRISNWFHFCIKTTTCEICFPRRFNFFSFLYTNVTEANLFIVVYRLFRGAFTSLIRTPLVRVLMRGENAPRNSL